MEARKAETKVVATVLALAALCVFSLFALAGNLEPSVPPGDNEVSYELAKKVAAHYANVRWDSVYIGQGQIYYAPDGTPEVYFFVVFKEGTPDRSEAELLSEIAALRRRRIKTQRDWENAPNDVAKTQAAIVQNLWSQMSGADKYATVVVGAHEGREPFIASYSGLPPHIFLREDAIEIRRQQIKEKDPGEPRYVWLQPLFVAFEFPSAEEQGERVFLEVRGTQFWEVPISGWKRVEVSNEVLRKRRQNWQEMSFDATYATQHTISGVPDYQNSNFADDNDCAPTAGACVLGYWDSHGYYNLITGSADYGSNPTGVTELVDFLKTDMGWTSSGTPIDNIPTGIEATANNRRGYSFSADNKSAVLWNDIKAEINADQPFVFSIAHPYYTGSTSHHSVTGVGYTEDAGTGGGTYHLTSVADSYVSSSLTNANYGSQSSFAVGLFGDGSEFRSYVRFDLTSIPAQTNIGSAKLRLYCNILDGQPNLIIWLSDSDWAENAITWNNQPGPNINIDPVRFFPLGQGMSWEVDVTSLVRRWVNREITNFGFCLTTDATQAGNSAFFSSKESGYAPWKPELVVNAGWSDQVVIVHDNWTQYFPYDPDVWLNFNECGTPTLTWIQPDGGCVADSYEPDNTYGQANEIFTNVPQKHNIVPEADVDWVWFSLAEESEIIIETSGPSGDTQMWLYDSSLTLLEYDNNGGTGDFSRIDRVCGVDALSAGTYCVKVDEYGNNEQICSYDITLTITTCGGAPGQLEFSSANYILREDGVATSITVSRVGGSYGPVTVDYATSDGTAIVDYDYLSSAGMLSFADGETSQSFFVSILDDNAVEDDETINLSLSNPTGGATLGSQNTAVLTIIDNEPDINNDGAVNLGDLSEFTEHWMNNCTEPNWCEGADFDSSTKVDFNDFAIFSNHWLDRRYDLIYNFRLDSNPGWITEGEWAFGQPTGGGGPYTHKGNPDPTSGYTGINVYGVNLNGDYTVAVGGPYCLIAGSFDCHDCRYVILKFARWLNTDVPEYVSSKIEASNNGTSWQTIWEHTGNKPIEDNDWEIKEYDISTLANHQSTVYIRWSYEIKSAEAWLYSGWNIDDIQLWGVR